MNWEGPLKLTALGALFFTAGMQKRAEAIACLDDGVHMAHRWPDTEMQDVGGQLSRVEFVKISSLE